jgi:hypothetical protein
MSRRSQFRSKAKQPACASATYPETRMTRAPILIPALAIAALLAATPVAAAPAATSKAQSASIEFELAANHGLRAHLETFNGEVTLEISRKDRLATYEIDGESTEAGLKAQFGKLGLIDVAFSPTNTRTEKPPKECEGPPSTWSEGLFVGTIEFTGEREYVRIEATQVKGTMGVYRELEWQCPGHKGPKPIQKGARQLSVLDSRERSEAEREPATLGASSRRCSCYFAAYAERGRRGRGPTAFAGVKFETREGMEIVRSTGVRAGPSTFVFDHAAGTARVNPPPPFSGNATFKRHPHSRDVWRSTIRAPFLGADSVSMYGPGFRAALIRDLPDD